jgi:hypothetical protein
MENVNQPFSEDDPEGVDQSTLWWTLSGSEAVRPYPAFRGLKPTAIHGLPLQGSSPSMSLASNKEPSAVTGPRVSECSGEAALPFSLDKKINQL